MPSGILKSVKIERESQVAVKGTDKPNTEPVLIGAAQPTATPAKQPETPQRLLAEAQAHVESMLNQAQSQAKSLRDEAKQAGWEAGYTEGKQAAAQEFESKLAALQQIAESAIVEKNQLITASQEQLGILAVAIAEKIIGQALNLNPALVAEIVAQAIKEARITGACRIRVHPEDYQLLSPSWNNIPSMQPSERKWDLVADDSLRRGGCIIEANGGVLDAQLDTQLAQVKRVFANVNG